MTKKRYTQFCAYIAANENEMAKPMKFNRHTCTNQTVSYRRGNNVYYICSFSA